MKKLLIVESPSKAKTIQKYVGDEYIVKSSKGHIVDLPKSDLGVDTGKNYQPTYVVTKKSVLSDLKKSLKSAEGLVLAVDPDREGEAIGWHVARELNLLDKKNKKKSLERIVFTEITKQAVQEALEHPRGINFDLVNAQQARRILDRLVGYKLSPLLWKKIRYGLSAGRVQSVAVRLIVDREIEREKFNPEEYWKINAFVSEDEKGNINVIYAESEDEKDKKIEEAKAELIEFNLKKISGKKPELAKQDEVSGIVAKVKEAKWQIDKLSTKESKRYPKPPFSTSALQQTASNKLGFSASRTMRAAQKLYEAGLITYMRTDSISISDQSIKQIRGFIKKEFGDKYLPKKAKNYSTKNKSAQEAHEAIRPTDSKKSAKQLKLKSDQQKLYDLIRDRAVASQMTPAILERVKATVDIDKYRFQASGQRVLFPGYLKLYPEKVSEKILPKLEEGQELYLNILEGTQHFTQPPGRYSEATLIKTLEQLGIGRPSTYAPTIQTILNRKYVEMDGRYFFPTDTGRVVNSLLVEHFPKIVDVNFTAKMEDDLDKVAEGDKDWVKMIDKFYQPFEETLEKKEDEIDKQDVVVLEESDVECPECGKPMVVKLGKYGRFLSCRDFPDCKGMLGLDEEGNVEKDPQEKVKTKEFTEMYLPAPKTDDKRDYELKKGRYGEFWAHPDYPKVKDAKPLQLRPEKIEELYGKPPSTEDGRDFVFRTGKYGPFWAHPDYPKTKKVISIKDKK